jgi:hypothetical protein
MLKKDESPDRLHPEDQDSIWILCVQNIRLIDYKSEKSILILAPTFDGRQTRKGIEKRLRLPSLDFDLLMCSI